MIVHCQRCMAKYRLDESRFPEERVKVKCSKCQNIFLVSKENPSHQEPPIQLSLEEESEKSVQVPFQCPNCGFQQPHSQECIKCGIIFSKYKPRSEMPPPPYPQYSPGQALGKNPLHDQAETIPRRYAGFWARFAANLIDGIILSLLISLPISILTGNSQTGSIVNGLAGVLYCILMWGSRGATLGKMAMKIKIVGTDGSDVSYGIAFLRYIGYFISAIPFCLGYLWMLWDGRKQTWHDKIASTCVIRTQ